VDKLSLMFMHGEMPSDMRSQILTTISGLSTAQQVRVAVYLVLTSSQYKIMH
jgi:heme/copper-type cytochrome/quinol oxidase subunit 4